MQTDHADNICFYCGRPIGLEPECLRCSAPRKSMTTEDHSPRYERREPFWYCGFVVWPIRDYSKDVLEFEFYSGLQCVARVSMSRDFLDDLSEGGKLDCMPYIYELALVASGENKEFILEIEAKNNIEPAVFVCHRVQKATHAGELDELMGLTLEQLRARAQLIRTASK